MSFPFVYHSFPFFPIKEMNCICETRCRCAKKQFDIHFYRIRSIRFLANDGKGASYEGRNGYKGVYFPAESVIQLLLFCL